MKIVKHVEFEPDDFKLISAAVAGNAVSVEDVPAELKEIIISVLKISANIRDFWTAHHDALSELKKIPVEIRRRYFSDFIKEATMPVKRYDCEGKHVTSVEYPLLEED